MAVLTMRQAPFSFQGVAVILIWMATVRSFPMRRMTSTNFNSSSYVAAAAADSPVIMSNKIRELLTSTFRNSSGLLPLWEEASNLAQGNLLKARYQRWEEKVCKGGVFNVKTVQDSCKDPSNLTYSELTNYYNELVIQLRLAEHNLNVTIDLEVKEGYLNNALKREKRIIKLLNESILPALEATLNISSFNTNCSATEALVDQIISLYVNCAADTLFTQTSLSLYHILDNPIISLYGNCATLQTFSTFLAQTSLRLYYILDNPDQISVHTEYDNDEILKEPDSCKKWCIV